MEIPDFLRNEIIITIQESIDGISNNPGRIEFYNNNGILMATAMCAEQSMVVNDGSGVFINVSPYLRGNVVVAGLVNRWAIINHDNTVVLTGTCGSPVDENKDILFNVLDLHIGDVIIIKELTLTIPAGNNEYLA